MSPPASQPSPPNKRRKTQLACHPCRARKTGCDGRKPCCGSCILRGWQERCSYQEPRSPSSAPTLVGLDRRLRKLEETAQQFPVIQSRTQATDSGNMEVRDGDTAIQDRSLSPMIDCDSGDGTTSNSLFVQQIASVLGSNYEHDNTDLILGSPIARRSTAYNLNDLVLPPRQLADDLLQCYWELFHPVSPVLHRPTFEAAYSKLWQPIDGSIHNKPHNVIFYATLNIVLALGSHRNEALATTERETLTTEFYKRSIALVSVDTLDTSSLQIVQLLLLRGFYLLFTPYADRCWTTVGVALRVAQAIGLQSAKTRPASNQLNQEMRRRVWHVCVMLDWMTSISFDRPLALSKYPPIPLPALIDDEYLSSTSEGQQPPNIPSRLTFFVYAMKLLDIREKSRLAKPKYFSIGRECAGQEFGAILDFISDLDRFLEDLPPYLQTDHVSAHRVSGNENCFKLQARVLKSRIMYARLSILRPFIVAEANRCVSSSTDNPSSKSTNVQTTLSKQLCTLCVSTAHEALEELHCQLSSVYRTSPWHSLYFTFAAASVLVAATLCPYLDVQLDRHPCKSSWEKALLIFAFHKKHVASAEMGIEALERLRYYIDMRGVSTNAAGGNSGSFASHMAADEEVPQPTAEIRERVDSGVPIDESWFFSQDFYFDDEIFQWRQG